MCVCVCVCVELSLAMCVCDIVCLSLPLVCKTEERSDKNTKTVDKGTRVCPCKL